MVAQGEEGLGRQLPGLGRVGADPVAAEKEGRRRPVALQDADHPPVEAGGLRGLLADVEGQGHLGPAAGAVGDEGGGWDGSRSGGRSDGQEQGEKRGREKSHHCPTFIHCKKMTLKNCR